LAQFGTISLERALAPAIRVAKEGFPVDQDYVGATREVLALYERHPALKETCRYVYETHLPGGRVRAVGDRLMQPALARLLEGIARNGPDFFYRGPVAKAVAGEMKQHGGILTAKDLAEYKVHRREPIRSTYREHELIGMPPPSSGGVALAETLNILETLDLPSIAKRDRGLAVHYQVEAMKHAFADRARLLGDSDFAGVPVAFLKSRLHAQQLASMLDPDKPLEIDTYGSAGIPDDGGTSHFCVVDRFGNVVASTETINTTFGSLAAVSEWGLILNNEMDDFVSGPGKPNAYGLVQSERNAIAPGKRPLSSMSPTIVLKNGKPYLLLGGSGGPRIISSVLNVLLSLTDYELSLEQAILSSRPHHQWQPDLVYFDAEPPQPVKAGLVKRGHHLAERRRTGIVQAILRTKNGWIGASDPRKGGRPAGY
jgi:gamma-glutamyltranspeptidase/glutathione hydrolase